MGKMKELEIDRDDLQTDDDFEFDQHVEECRQQEREERLRDKRYQAEIEAERETRLQQDYMAEKHWWLAIDSDEKYQQEQGEV